MHFFQLFNADRLANLWRWLGLFVAPSMVDAESAQICEAPCFFVIIIPGLGYNTDL